MKRQSFKYIFFLNLLFITVCTVITFFSGNTSPALYSSSLTTPIISRGYEKQSFCSNAKSAVTIDGKSGAVLYDKNTYIRLPMASTTKIMTALTVLNHADTSAVITVDKKAEGIEGSSIYLRAGEKLTVLDLLYGLMLESGNDAATALAIGCFGSEKVCVEKMNELCKTLGLVDTHFDNVHGLDGENHYTSAYELARITSEAMKNPIFKQIVSTKNYTSQGENPKYFSNHNRLLRTYDGAIGVKTGYTSKAGRCLVTCAERGNERYIAVTLGNGKSDWQDHADMLDFAFDNYSCREIADTDSFYIYRGFDKYMTSEDIYLTVKGDEAFAVDYKITFDKKSGSALCEYYSEKEKLGHFNLSPIS